MSRTETIKYSISGTCPFSCESYEYTREFPAGTTRAEAQRWVEANTDWDGYFGPPSVSQATH